jgi:hypothetical protein
MLFVQRLKADGLTDSTIEQITSDHDLRLRIIRSVQPPSYELPLLPPQEAVKSLLDALVFDDDTGDYDTLSDWRILRNLLLGCTPNEQQAMAVVHGLDGSGQHNYRQAGEILEISGAVVARRVQSARMKLMHKAVTLRAYGSYVDSPIAILDLPTRAETPLRRAGIMTLGHLLQRSAEDLLELVYFGEGQLAIVRASLASRGLYLKHEAPAS